MILFLKGFGFRINADIFEQTKKILEWGGVIGYNECVFDKNHTAVILLIKNMQSCLLTQAVRNVLAFNLELFQNIMLIDNAKR